MNKSYIAGFCDGDGSIFISKCKTGYQLMFEIMLCNSSLLEEFRAYFGTGSIYTDSRTEKYSFENAGKLRICGLATKPASELMRDHAVIKHEQALFALEFLPLINKQGRGEEKKALCKKLEELNADKTSYIKQYDKINDAYIAGLMDAEGSIYINKECIKLRYYVKITQKCDPELIKQMQTYLKSGIIYDYKGEPYRLRFDLTASLFCWKSSGF
jgi:hypothetical protein